MTEELKPCPFCRNFPRKAYVDTLCCNNKTCPIFDYPFKTSDWNTRAEPAPFQYGIRHNAVEDYLYDEKGLRPAPLPGEAYDINSKFSKRNAGELIAYCDEILSGKNELMPGVLRAHIASLEVENKRLLESLAFIANTDPDDGGSREFPDYAGSLEVCHEKAREALASHKTPEVIYNKPDPQKCGTCGGPTFSKDGSIKLCCPDCNGTGKQGVEHPTLRIKFMDAIGFISSYLRSTPDFLEKKEESILSIDAYVTNLEYGPLGELGIKIYKDGDAWCAIYEDFVDLQNSKSGFGDTPREALENLRAQTDGKAGE